MSSPLLDPEFVDFVLCEQVQVALDSLTYAQFLELSDGNPLESHPTQVLLGQITLSFKQVSYTITKCGCHQVGFKVTWTKDHISYLTRRVNLPTRKRCFRHKKTPLPISTLSMPFGQ